MYYLIGFSTYRKLDYATFYELVAAAPYPRFLVWGTGIKLVNSLRFDSVFISYN